MRFLPDPERPRATPRPDHPAWGWLLFSSAFLVIGGTMRPWTRVRFERLWGEHVGLPGWNSSAGFTCLFACLLVVVMALAETRTPSSQSAVRPASLLLVAIAAAALAVEWHAGPGEYRGVEARWTVPFYVASSGLPILLLACWRRWAAARARA